MFYQWIIRKPNLSDIITSLQNNINISPVLAQLLFEREIDSPEKVQKFLNPDLDYFERIEGCDLS